MWKPKVNIVQVRHFKGHEHRFWVEAIFQNHNTFCSPCYHHGQFTERFLIVLFLWFHCRLISSVAVEILSCLGVFTQVAVPVNIHCYTWQWDISLHDAIVHLCDVTSAWPITINRTAGYPWQCIGFSITSWAAAKFSDRNFSSKTGGEPVMMGRGLGVACVRLRKGKSFMFLPQRCCNT